jgi:hypothetical protein
VNERLLVAIAHPKAAVTVSTSLGQNLPGSFAPTAAVQTSGTEFPKRSFACAAANGWVGW